MKKVNFIIVFMFTILMSALSAYAGPVAHFTDPVVMFEPVAEGTPVEHSFTVQNKGDEVLKITNVQPGWGCDAVYYDKEILPGEEGKVKIVVNTKEYGGKLITKTAIVKTNDPNNEKIHLKLKGTVEGIVKITPDKVHFKGLAGEDYQEVITITPEKKYSFSITDMEVKANQNIDVKLEKVDSEEPSWTLTVKNISKTPGMYFDIIVLKTDSKIKPEIKIRVYAMLKDKSQMVEEKEENPKAAE